MVIYTTVCCSGYICLHVMTLSISFISGVLSFFFFVFLPTFRPLSHKTNQIHSAPLTEGGSYWACTGAIHRLVDESLLGPSHMDAGGLTKDVYWTEAFDRFGVLNAFIMSAVVSLVGVTLGGRICALVHTDKGRSMGQSPRADGRLIMVWTALGLFFIVAGLVLEYACKWPVRSSSSSVPLISSHMYTLLLLLQAASPWCLPC